MKQVNTLETKYPVDEWMVDDIRVWPIIKINLLHTLYRTRIKPQSAVPSKSKSNLLTHKFVRVYKELSIFLKGLYYLLRIQKRLKQKLDLLFISYVAHRQEVNKIHYNRFCDLFIEYGLEHDLQSMLIELKGPYKEYRVPRSNSKAVFEGDVAINAFMKLKKVRSLFTKKEIQQTFNGYDQFLDEVSFLFGKELVEKLSRARILSQAKSINAASLFFDYIFSQQKPKMAFCVCYYASDIDFALQLSAYRNKVPTIDIQHGIQGEYHAAYGSWYKVPAGGYNLLPKHFWNWDSQSSEEINKWSRQTLYHSSINGGNPWLKLWEKKQFNNVFEVNALTDSFKNRKVILFSFQPLQDPFPDFIKQVIKETETKFVWLMRVHPTQMNYFEQLRNEVNALQTTNVIIEEASKLPLPLLLSYTDLHMTFYSTVAIEAAMFKVPTFFIGQLGKLYYSSLPKELVTFDIVNSEELKEKLKNISFGSIKKEERNSFLAWKELDKLLANK